MLFKEISLYSENRTKPIIQNAALLILKDDDSHTYHWALKLKIPLHLSCLFTIMSCSLLETFISYHSKSFKPQNYVGKGWLVGIIQRHGALNVPIIYNSCQQEWIGAILPLPPSAYMECSGTDLLLPASQNKKPVDVQEAEHRKFWELFYFIF
jgi:hypothetical protein